MNQNLNQISNQMPFGHTDYIPLDETRNFKALVPLSDEIKDRLDTLPSIVLKVDSEQYPPDEVAQFEENIKENPLPASDYRRLLWGRRVSKFLELPSLYNGSVSPASISRRPRRSLGLPQRYRRSEDVNIPELEAWYRKKPAVPFRFDLIACHLFDQPIALSHAKKLKLRLGHETVALNDPDFMNSLCKQIQNEMENTEETLSRQREEKEALRSAAAKKKSRFAVDEYFEAMHLPELCSQKPWLWTCKKNNHITRECDPEDVMDMTKLPPIQPKCPKRTKNPCCFRRYRKRYGKVWATNSFKTSSPSDESRSRIFRMDTATSEELDDEGREEETGTLEEGKVEDDSRVRGEEEEEGASEDEEEMDENDEHFYMEDRMSEMKTVNQLFANAFGILNSSKEFTKYPITLVDREEMNEEANAEGEGEEERV